ncbi:NCS1 family nucleobase:cation symporter-1 [Streptomyces sp. NPDC007983]|uniref:NCS1 family nucleobase:cation symporter-1 n=1 Tax=Streptomyces sp. NPDC007983 TaxID=3364800 RepID=UPI0036E0EE58
MIDGDRDDRGAAPADPSASARSTVSPSPRLYNKDLAPTQVEGRRWRSYNVFTLWANDVHSLGNYTFAIGLFALGLGAWQILLALAIGAALLFGILNLAGYMGHKTGVPFPVMSRISFGVRGAQIPALIRGAVAIAWFGIQTYLASHVLNVLLIAVYRPFAGLTEHSFLGLSALGWISFGLLWTVQIVIVMYGLEMVRKYEAFAGPVILVTLCALAIWMFVRAGGSIALSAPNNLEGGHMWREIFAGASLWVSIYGTFALNFCDFTRSCTSKRAITVGNFCGIPVNIMLFGIISIVISGAQFQINGKTITSPADVVQDLPNTLFVALASLALIILTIAVNLMANFVAPAYALANLFPKHLNFRRAGVVSGVIGIAILPWNLYNNPTVVNYFLGGLGALLGPLFGVVVADYWLIRKGRVNVPQLYTMDASGPYHYTRGFNPRAIAAFVPAAVLAVLLALVPAFAPAAPFAWFIGAGVAAVAYFLVSNRKEVHEDVSGAEIAVPCAD